MFNRLTQRARSLVALASKPQFEYLETRIGNLEAALHRDLAEVRGLIDERAFAMAQLAAANARASIEASMDASMEAFSARLAAQAEASREHAEAAARVMFESGQRYTDAESARIAVKQSEEAVAAYAAGVADQFARFRSELSRLARQETGPTRVNTGGAGTGLTRESSSTAAVDDLLYLAIEDRFRGDPQVIRERQEQYLPIVGGTVDHEHPLLDLGCGRGEWLRLLMDAGIPARGVDSNSSCVAECLEFGLTASVGDLVETLSTSGDRSFGAITMFHVVEHLPFEVLSNVFIECARVLVPGGLLVAETPNALNLRVAATNFWLDPTHIHPLHPELLRLLGERSGFARFEDLFLNDIGVPLRVSLENEPVDRWLTDLNRSLEGPGDYALLAWTPSTD